MIGIKRMVDIGKSLSFHALRGIDDQQRPFTGSKRTTDLIGKVDMARSVHQVEDIGFSILRGVIQSDGLRFDGDAAFALDIHRIQNLFDHFAFGQPAGELDQPVGKRGFTVVDMRHDREVADIIEFMCGHAVGLSVRGLFSNKLF